MFRAVLPTDVRLECILSLVCFPAVIAIVGRKEMLGLDVISCVAFASTDEDTASKTSKSSRAFTVPSLGRQEKIIRGYSFSFNGI